MTALGWAPSLTDVELVACEAWATYAEQQDGLLTAPGACWPGDANPSDGGPVGCATLTVGPQECWSAAVTAAGEQPTMIAVDLHRTAAQQLASSMLDLPVDQVDDEDVSDAVGELANIVAGNLKALMPGATHLSLPIVSTSPLRSPSGVVLRHSCSLQWRDAPVRVRVLSSDPVT